MRKEVPIPAADVASAQAFNARWVEQSFTARSSSPPVSQVVLIHNDDAAHALVLAELLCKRKEVSLEWLAEKLGMKSAANASQQLK